MMIQRQRPQRPRTGISKALIAVAAISAVILVVVFVYYFDILRKDLFTETIKTGQSANPLQGRPTDPAIEGFNTVRIFFISDTNGDIKSQEVKIPSTPVTAQMIESIIAELFKSMPEGLRGIQLYAAYKDKDNVVYLDFNQDLRNRATISAAQEFLLLSSIYRSITSNIQGLTDIRLLIEGRETETVAGHFYILKGLKEAGIF